MKYAKFNDDFLSYFRLDDNGETLVLTDKRGFTRAVRLLPYEDRPQGEWIEVSRCNSFITYKCSCCRIHRITINNPDKCSTNMSIEEQLSLYPYCHCGADMRGDKE